MTTAEPMVVVDPSGERARPWGPWQTGLAILRRDLFVTGREFPIFLAQVILQPLFLLFVFGKVLTQLGYARPGYAEVLFPGLVALAAVLTGLQSTALPLVIEFSYSNEIEDRLLAPLPIGAVALEKIVIAAVRATIAAAVMFPIGIWLLGSIPWTAGAAAGVIAMTLIGALLGASMGLVLGTFVSPNRINVTFALVLTPLLFTGSSQYPWPSLSHIRWFQVVSACNPMTYVSEGLRGLMVPSVPHIQTWICFVAAIGAWLILTAIGMIGFRRRAVG
ncbi:MAG TPA: ABC transporter permease [Acidimicrobiales bacterium]|jgi:ABC-2 type transport system permease protein|nr:ABC transporter permease [Acidimicrobiales bacterium]